jgi:hypothetical protein
MLASGRSHAVRITALALAAAVNLLFLSLWLFSRAHIEPEAVVTAMIWITAPLPARSLTRPPLGQKSRASSRRTPNPTAPAPAPEQSTAITIAPIDWHAEGARSARNAYKDTARENPEPLLDSKPKILVLPDKSNLPHKKGDTEKFEGGEVITWINERCYYTNRPGPMTTFGGASQKVCKVRSMAERRSEAMAAELEKAVKPDYLSRPLPLPPLQPEPTQPGAEVARD